MHVEVLTQRRKDAEIFLDFLYESTPAQNPDE